MSGTDDETRMLPPDADAPTMITPSVSRPISSSVAAARAAAAPLPGAKRIGDYDLESEIARGGMGIVYRARQLSLNRPVAFKMILSGQFASEADVERFHVEAEAAAGLDHPNIVPIYEVGAFEGTHFFTMKFIDGRSMAHEMPRLVKAPRDGVRLLVKVCRAIHYAHQHSILHRDLKPANILLDAAGEPHVTDFGLAKRTGSDSQLTQTGAIVGTPSYMAPEQAAPSKTPLTTAADVYSLGAILYEILTGRPPFKGDSPLDTLMLVLNKEADRPRSINATADRDLETIAMKCLEKDPARRYGSAEALAEDLDRWLNNEPILARPIGATERVGKWAKRHPAIAALAVTIAAVTILGVAGIVWQWREAVYQRGLTAQALVQVAEEARNAEAARKQEATQRAAAEAAQGQEAIARKAADDQRVIAVGALGSAERSLYFNNIDLADREWAANNIGHVDQLLAASPPASRGWEWNYLNRLAHNEEALIPASDWPIVALAVSPDGTRATIITADLNASVWNLQTHRRERLVKLEGRPGTDVGARALSADGRTFAASMTNIDGGKLSAQSAVWDTVSGRALFQLRDQGFLTVTAFALSPDGSRLVTASIQSSNTPSGTVPPAGDFAAFIAQASGFIASNLRVRDARTGQELAPIGVVNGLVSSLVFSPDGSRIVASGTTVAAPATPDGEIRILDASNGKVLATLNHAGDVSPVFSRDGTRIAAVAGKYVRVWSSSTGGNELWSWWGEPAAPLTFSADGRTLAIAATDRSIQLLDATNGVARSRMTGSASPVTALGFAGSGDSVVSVDGGNLRIFRPRVSAPPVVAQGAGGTVSAIGITPDLSRLVCTTANGTLRAWDVQTGRELFSSAPGGAVMPSISQAALTSGSPRMYFSGDSRRVALARFAGNAAMGFPQAGTGLLILDTATGREVARFDPPPKSAPASTPVPAPAGPPGMAGPVRTSLTMAMAQDEAGTHAAVAIMNMSVTIQTARGGSVMPDISVDGTEVHLWRAPREQPVATILLKDAMVAALEISPDGRRLILLAGAYSSAGPIAAEYRVYDTATGRFLAAFPGDKQAAPMAFSRDSRFMAAATARNTVTIWDLETSRRTVVVAEHRLPVTRLAFSPDGTRLASLSGQGVTLFDTLTGNQLFVLHDNAGPYTEREFIVPVQIARGTVTSLAFSADGHQIIQSTIATHPKGASVRLKTWDGSPVAKR